MFPNIYHSSLIALRGLLHSSCANLKRINPGLTKGYLRQASRMAKSSTGISEQNFDYFLVLDFEATCDDITRLRPQEIIEFPVLKVNGKNFKTEAVFHQYVQPTVHPDLTPFCTELTGIIQDMIDGQPNLTEVLEKFHTWMEEEGLLKEDTKSIFVTSGDWDLKVMLPKQCRHFNIIYPDYLKTWINLKNPYADLTTQFPKGMMYMLSALGLKHEGRHHSGIDDCRNIANILKALAEKGYVFRPTGSIVDASS